MEIICSTEKCVGCFACKSICPKNAVSVTEDKLGKTVPEIDKNLCIDCGLCSKICPVNKKSDFHKIQKCFAAYTKNDKDREECASGGIGSAFARKIFEQGGLIVGSVFENGIPKQKLLSKNDDWEKIKGSKYVQSFTDSSYQDTKQAIENGKKVLYTGTPCQIDGLYSFLRKDYENLITVDLICHGTPPVKYLNEYCESVCKGQKYTDVTFRGKNDWFLSIYNKNDLIYKKDRNSDRYFIAFLEGMTYRDNCFSCPYAKPDRVSDITIGDFWGLDWSTLKFPHPKKVSVILANTQKGLEFIDSLKDTLYIEERDIKEAVDGNAQLRRPSVLHPERSVFTEKYPQIGFAKAVNTSAVRNKIKRERIHQTILYRGLRKCKRILKKVAGKK